jgi:diphthamide synthase subunit DPH2
MLTFLKALKSPYTVPPKIEFIKAKAEIKIEIPKSILKKLPKKICLVTTIQHLDQVQKLKAKLGAMFGNISIRP